MNSSKSVISFYSIDDELAQLSYREVWDKFIINKEADISCKNIFHCAMGVDDLADTLKDRANIDPLFLADIEFEHLNGANFMFVQPIVGEPIAGFHLASYIQ
jgi:hypothetical protein